MTHPTLAAFASLVCGAAAVAVPPAYEVTIVGTPSAASSSAPVAGYPLGINLSARVVGYSDLDPMNWKDGVARTMTGPVFDRTFARSVNNLGRVVGAGYVLDGQGVLVESRALKWTGGVATDLGTLGGRYAAALVINNQNDTILGYSSTPGDAQFKAFRYANGRMTAFETLPGASESYPYDLSDNGIIAGAAAVNGKTRPFRIRSGVVSELSVPAGVRAGAAHAVSVIGAAVGTYEIDQFTGAHAAVMWRVSGERVDLGNLGGAIPFAVAKDINHGGQVVGQSLSPDGLSGFIWQQGVMHDLNLLQLGGLGSGVRIVSANAINDHGVIAAAAEINGVQTAVLLTPVVPGVPGPGAVTLLAASGVLAFRRRRGAGRGFAGEGR